MADLSFSGNGRHGPELLLEPAPVHFEPSKVFQECLDGSRVSLHPV